MTFTVSTDLVSSTPARRDREPRGGFIRRHPLTAFFVWFFTVGQVVAFTPVFLAAAGIDVGASFQLFIIAATIVGLMLPAVLITRIVDGPAAMRQFLRRTVDFRGTVGWYLLALVAAPVVGFGVLFALYGWPAGMSAMDVLATLGSVYGVQLVLSFLPNNWLEEAAWSGFVQARLQQRHSTLIVALIVAPLFAAQHAVLFVTSGAVAGLVLFAALTLLSIPFRMLSGWIFNRTGSVVLIGLFHAAGNAIALGSGFGPGWTVTMYPDSIAGFAQFLAYAIIAVPVLIVTRGRLGDSRARRVRDTVA